jgi:hypothetical protein
MNRSGFWAYLMTRQEAGVMSGAPPATLPGRELRVATERRTHQTQAIFPSWQAQSGRPAYDRLLGPDHPLSIQSMAQAGTATIIKLTDHSQWALTLVNYLPQSCPLWMPTDRVTITADDQTYLLYNHRLHAFLRVLYWGQDDRH